CARGEDYYAMDYW
nr:immunoglobulin heavy chain junction region [Mus musculus]MBK4184170.1 immunoglobulin heavy chain junction region [Mus musculus]